MPTLNTFEAVIATLIIALLIPLWGVSAQWIVARIERIRFRREGENLTTERRRLAEVNISMRQKLDVTQDRGAGYLVLRLPLVNLGDGPVDILGTLVSAREVSSSHRPFSTRSRDVGWADYVQYSWMYPGENEPFCGISTTRYLTVAADQFPRLAVREDLELLRVEAVANPTLLDNSRYLMFRIFLVARGYSLGEISRQLGGRPRDPLRTVRPQLLQFQPLAQPNYYRWAQVQRALFNLNRFIFRMATHDTDPLGKLATPNAWRIFLLHHWDFIDQEDASPDYLRHPQRAMPADAYRCPLQPGTSTKIVIDVTQEYHDQVLPDNWSTDSTEHDKFNRVSAMCAERLHPMIDRWNHMLETIDSERDFFSVPEKEKQGKEWYPHLIHSQPEYRDRWMALMEEGYLISAPNRSRWRRFRRTPPFYTEQDIPADPRSLEPFVMRTRFFLAEARLGKKSSSASTIVTGTEDESSSE